MGYVQKTIVAGESILLVGQLHWLIYSRAIVLMGLFLALLTASLAVSEKETGLLLWFASGVVLIFGLFSLLSTAIYVYTTEVAVTSRRVIFKSGLIARNTAEMNLNRVESVEVHQSIIGRIFGYGTINVRGTGAGIENLRMIVDPLVFRSAISMQ